LHDQIAARAEEAERSLTTQCEILIEQALFAERAMGGKVWRIGYDVMRALDGAVRAARMADPKDDEPLAEPTFYMTGMMAAIEALAAHFPAEPSPDFPSRAAQIQTTIQAALMQAQEQLQ
jgi:hypothetical protein